MASPNSGLETGLGLFDRRRLFTWTGIGTYIFVGLAIVIAAMSGMWNHSGHLSDPWSWSRIIALLVTIAYGFGLGWMLFPRTWRSEG